MGLLLVSMARRWLSTFTPPFVPQALGTYSKA